MTSGCGRCGVEERRSQFKKKAVGGVEAEQKDRKPPEWQGYSRRLELPLDALFG